VTRFRFQDALIRVTDRSRAERRLLGPISFDTNENETIVLCGTTGSGKSLLLELASGLRSPQEGKVLLDGVRIDRLSPSNRGIGLLTQDAALYDHLSVRENIAFGLSKVPSRDAQVAKAASTARCTAVLERNPIAGGLSGGERRRVALAKALAIEPRVLLLDEPFEGLDTVTHQSMRIELRRWLGTRCGPTLIALHDQEDAIALADRILLLESGMILQIGTPTELMEQPNSARVAQLFQTETPSVLRGRREGGRIHLPGGFIDHHIDLPDGEVDVVVPPRAIRLTDEGLEEWQVIAEEPTRRGPDHLLRHREDTEGEEILRFSAETQDQPLKVGSYISIKLMTDHLMVFARP
jgi:ABC-type sulfate/molybdate transport systems ATPase subunit